MQIRLNMSLQRCSFVSTCDPRQQASSSSIQLELLHVHWAYMAHFGITKYNFEKALPETLKSKAK